MPEHKSFMVIKAFDPAGPYAETLSPLSEPDSFEVLVSEPGLVIERRDLTLEEAQRVASRQHVERVVEEGYADAPPEPEIRADSTRVTGQRARELHGVPAVWGSGYRGKGQIVAVLDTGIRKAQADKLKAEGRLVGALSRVPGGTGYDETHGHGPWCIECISQIAPEAKILSVQVLDPKNGSGSSSGIVGGMSDAKAKGATVVSQSLGGPGDPNDAMSRGVDSLRGAGINCPCAAGNEQRGSTTLEADVHHPGCAARSLTVPAFDSDLRLADFSNWGRCNDAGGIGVLVEAGGVYMSGTSMATPHIAGIVALLRSAKNDADLVEQALYTSCTDTPYEAVKEGHGFARADLALEKLIGAAPSPKPAPTPDPVGPTRVGLSTLNTKRKDYFGKDLVIFTKDDDNSPEVDRWRATPLGK